MILLVAFWSDIFRWAQMLGQYSKECVHGGVWGGKKNPEQSLEEPLSTSVQNYNTRPHSFSSIGSCSKLGVYLSFSAFLWSDKTLAPLAPLFRHLRTDVILVMDGNNYMLIPPNKCTALAPGGLFTASSNRTTEKQTSWSWSWEMWIQLLGVASFKRKCNWECENQPCG